jgi:ferredoxin
MTTQPRSAAGEAPQMTTTLKLRADKPRCIGSAACLGSSILMLDGAGKIEVLADGVVPEDETEEVQDAVTFCPVSALRLDRQLVLDCPCGERITGFGEDELVAAAGKHLAGAHPGRDYSRKEILALAR